YLSLTTRELYDECGMYQHISPASCRISYSDLRPTKGRTRSLDAPITTMLRMRVNFATPVRQASDTPTCQRSM
ncbi:MAG: hypothetical protein U0936_27245, partial [Planctomycetaceae bacterium]